jgi:cbb3-type cytochrome oxidase subunit 1
LVGGEWRSGKMIRFHFWFSTYGVVALVSLLFIAGLVQAMGVNHGWDEGFYYGVSLSRGMIAGTAVGWLFIFASNLVFLLHLSLMVCRRGLQGDGPTLLHEPHHAAPVTSTDGEITVIADPSKA